MGFRQVLGRPCLLTCAASPEVNESSSQGPTARSSKSSSGISSGIKLDNVGDMIYDGCLFLFDSHNLITRNLNLLHIIVRRLWLHLKITKC